MTHATRALIALVTTLLVVGLGTFVGKPARAVPARIEAGTGSTAMADQVLRRGCRPYTYAYTLSPSTREWLFETFLLDPDRHAVAAGVLGSDSDANPGTSTFTICRSSTRFGTFKLRGRLTTYDGYDQAARWIAPTYVRLHRWGR